MPSFKIWAWDLPIFWPKIGLPQFSWFFQLTINLTIILHTKNHRKKSPTCHQMLPFAVSILSILIFLRVRFSLVFIPNLALLYQRAFLRLPPTRGRLLVFVRFRPPARAGGAWTPPLIHVTLISTKPLFQFIWCSTYWIQVLIPRLHQFFKKIGKIFGSLRPSLTFFRQFRTLSPWYLPNRFFNSLCVQHTGCKY